MAETYGTRRGHPVTNDYDQLVTIDDGRVSAVRNYCWGPKPCANFFAHPPETVTA